MPASAGAHGGLACAFLIGSVDGEPDLLLIEAIEDQTIRDPEVVRKAANYTLEAWKPLVGENLFMRESGAVASQLHIPEAIEQSVLAGVRAV